MDAFMTTKLLRQPTRILYESDIQTYFGKYKVFNSNLAQLSLTISGNTLCNSISSVSLVDAVSYRFLFS